MRESQIVVIDLLEKERAKLDERLKGNKLQRSRAQEALDAFDAEQCALIVDIGKIDDAIEFTKKFQFPDA